jgi:hypothetical protein
MTCPMRDFENEEKFKIWLREQLDLELKKEIVSMRNFEDEKVFMAWIRNNYDLDSIGQSLAVNNVDITSCNSNELVSLDLNTVQFNKFAGIVNGGMNRQTRRLINMEFKFWNCFPEPSQLETLYFNHKSSKGIYEFNYLNGRLNRLYHFGCYIMSLPELLPQRSTIVKWYIPPDNIPNYTNASYKPKLITIDQVIQILLFKISPITLRPIKLEKNAQTYKVDIVEEVSPGVWEEVKF